MRDKINVRIKITLFQYKIQSVIAHFRTFCQSLPRAINTSEALNSFPLFFVHCSYQIIRERE